MRRRQAPADRWPRHWLMTDERLGDGLWAALDRLPTGSGIVFRHYSLDRQARAALFARIARVAARRRLVLLVAGPPVGRRWQRAGRHNARGPEGVSRSVHSAREAMAARRAGVALAFVSPVHPTRSHPGAFALGHWGFARLARLLPVTVIALGGMDAHRARRLAPLGADGWAAIDAWQR